MKESASDFKRIEEPMDPALAEAIYELDRCIECGCCVAGCGTARMREDFVGAVGLNKIARFRLDPRDKRTDADYYELVGDDNGVFGCMSLLGLPRRLPEEPSAADADRVPAPEDGLGGNRLASCSAGRPGADEDQTKGVAMARIEKDFLGEKQLPDDAYYGVQTLRGKENFHITGIPMSLEPNFVKAFGYAKKAAAMANRDLGVLDKKVAEAIIYACDRLIAGEFRDQFVTDFIQGGAGTSTNMNANEVIANLALEKLGHKKGEYQFVNPNDHVNFGQSTNDMYPTAFRLALILRLANYMEALTKLQQAFFAKAKEFDRVLKMGRTHLQDAVPMSLGQEFHGWGTTIGEEVQRIAEVRQFLHEINLGATAIGTTVTAAPGYPELATKYLSEITGTKFILAGDLVEATSDTGAYVLLSGVLKRTSSKLTKICNDLRLARLRARAAGSTRSTCRRCSRARPSCRAR